MRVRRRHHEIARTLIVGIVLAHLLLILAAVGRPALHAWVHSDAGDANHECAITLFASGACQDAPAPVVAPAPELIPVADEVAIERPRIVSSFRFSGILEHAPPRRT